MTHPDSAFRLVKGDDLLTRRRLVKFGVMGAATGALSPGGQLVGMAQIAKFSSKRPLESKRQFRSEIVEREIRAVRKRIGDAEMGWLFENCYPNTLDTTVFPGTVDGKPDTFVVTGDIDAMWLRDSSAQVWHYLGLAKEDVELRRLIEGVIRRQVRCLMIDPYANAFQRDPTAKAMDWALHDSTTMLPGVAERKWEIDSVCYTIRLAHGYWRSTGDKSPFDESWRAAMHLVVETLQVQQRKQSRGPYHFQRASENPTDSLNEGGYGTVARPVGLIHSGFRPSDDACVYPFLIPSNMFAVAMLRKLEEMAREILHDQELTLKCRELAAEVEQALSLYGRMQHGRNGQIWAYEVDGFGNALFADDANLPSLLSLPYLGCAAVEDSDYLRTRVFVLGDDNPYFFRGKAADGVGGPHIGANQIWPMSIVMRALTSTSPTEIRRCLHWLKTTHAGTGFMHESFDKDDPAKFTRPWFAWANSLFGELIMKVSRENPALLA